MWANMQFFPWIRVYGYLMFSHQNAATYPRNVLLCQVDRLLLKEMLKSWYSQHLNSVQVRRNHRWKMLQTKSAGKNDDAENVLKYQHFMYTYILYNYIHSYIYIHNNIYIIYIYIYVHINYSHGGPGRSLALLCWRQEMSSLRTQLSNIHYLYKRAEISVCIDHPLLLFHHIIIINNQQQEQHHFLGLLDLHHDGSHNIIIRYHQDENNHSLFLSGPWSRYQNHQNSLFCLTLTCFLVFLSAFLYDIVVYWHFRMVMLS